MVTITGSEGFIGKHLDIPGDKVDLKLGRDICDLDGVGEVVIHLAAVSSIVESFENPEETMRTNITGLAHVLQLCKRNHSKLIFTSSSGVIDPQSPYVYSKLWGERLIQDSGVDYVVLRLGNVYGEGDTKGALWHFTSKPEITINGSGQQIRNFVHVSDVAEALKAAVHMKPNVVLNVGKENLSIQQVAEMFGKPISYGPPRRGDALSHAMESDWKCQVSLRDWVAKNG